MIFTHGRAKEMLCKCCANLGIKKVKVLKSLDDLLFQAVEPDAAVNQLLHKYVSAR